MTFFFLFFFLFSSSTQHIPGSHTPSSEDLSPFLEGGCCYLRSLSDAEDSLHISIQRKTCRCSLGVLPGVTERVVAHLKNPFVKCLMTVKSYITVTTVRVPPAI